MYLFSINLSVNLVIIFFKIEYIYSRRRSHTTDHTTLHEFEAGWSAKV